MSVKLKCPENVNSVNVGGEQYNADKKGHIEIEQSIDYSMLLGAGFIVVTDEVSTKGNKDDKK